MCDAQWRDEDSLMYVPGIRTPERATLADGGMLTLALLGELEFESRDSRRSVSSGWCIRQRCRSRRG